MGSSKIGIGLALFFCVHLAYAAQLSISFDTNSSAGDFFGGISLSFNDTNGSDYSYDDLGRLNWNPAQWSACYTDLLSGAAISIAFTVGGEGAYQLNLYASLISIYIPQTGTIPAQDYLFSSGRFAPDQPVTNSMTSQPNTLTYYDPTNNVIVSYDFRYSLPVTWDGTSGAGLGNWSVTYDVTAVPEPSAFALGVAGTIGIFGFGRKFRRHSAGAGL